ncbi:ABC transporter permease [Oceanobacillus picturae]|nr:ABC transporter permease [Oceanobacillus picturae]
MFWKYFLFETKLMVRNRKNLFLGALLALFFPIFFFYYSDTEVETIESEKRSEQAMIEATFDSFPMSQEETPEGAEIHEIYLEQSSLVNYQLYYLAFVGLDETNEEYIENGLQLNALRLRVHDLDNQGIPPQYIIPKEDVLQSNAFLQYALENQIQLEPDPFVATNYLIHAFSILSGLFFLLFMMISGSEILLYEEKHQTVMKGFPLSFMNKIHAKVIIHFLYMMVFLTAGIIAGGYIAAREAGLGNLSYPVMIFMNNDYVAIPALQYYMYILLAIALIVIVLYYTAALFNTIFKSAYATVLLALVIFYIPDLSLMIGWNTVWLHPIKVLDIAGVLSGDIAVQFGNEQIDYGYAMIWLAIFAMMIAGVLKLIQWRSYKVNLQSVGGYSSPTDR